MKDFAEKFYKSSAWQQCRSSYIAERVGLDGGMCQRCHDAPGYIVHHTIELTPQNISDPEVALNHRLLEYVCLECHNREHKHFAAARRCIFDADGNVIDCR